MLSFAFQPKTCYIRCKQAFLNIVSLTTVLSSGHLKDGTMAQKKLKKHSINREWCKGCGICAAFCPKNVLEMDEAEKAVAARQTDCICCRLCELRCPDLAIEIETQEADT